MPHLPTTSVIVSTSRDPLRLRIVLERLNRQTGLPSQVLVAEDGEDAETRSLLHEVRAQLRFPLIHVRQPHLGFRKSRILNEAILHASADYIILLDGDCAPHSRFLDDHLSLARENYFVQGRRSFIEEDGIPSFARGDSLLRLWLSGALKRPFKSVRLPFPRIKEDARPDGTLGCNLGVWRADLKAIDGFDEAYEGWGREDVDMTTRLLHLGRRRRTVWGHALVYHLNHPIQSRSQLSHNDQLIAELNASRRVRATRGLSQHSSSTPVSRV